ncbi:hypothetical protein HYZ80_03075 [Candidatus Parcubacteria bacterium]|nr:hypothetical protein [Candidatus Parcubacteria bacterium]
MVKTLTDQNRTLFACEACGFRYPTEDLAQRCEAWCREHRSCNLEIIKYGLPPTDSSAAS